MENLGIEQKYFEPMLQRTLGEVSGNYTYFADGDVLMAKITPCFENGKLGIARNLTGQVGFGSSEYIVLRPGDKLTNQFLYYYLLQDSFRDAGIRTMSGAVGHKRVSKEFVERFPIPLPPLTEQKRIVAILDEVFAGFATAIANAEKNIRNARALFESHLESVFRQRGNGWVEKPLETVASILNGYAFKSTDFSAQEGAKCVKITNVGVREFVSNSESYLPSRFLAGYKSVSVKKGAIVLALTRTIIAEGLKVAIVPDEYDGALLNQRVASITPDDKQLNGAFLFAFFSTQTVIDYVKERVNTLMQPNMSVTDLRSMPIPMPPREKQDLITEQLDRLRAETQHVASIYRQKLAAISELKQSLLRRAFTGELTSTSVSIVNEAAE
jgi:type I restriction enzyme S subunit